VRQCQQCPEPSRIGHSKSGQLFRTSAWRGCVAGHEGCAAARRAGKRTKVGGEKKLKGFLSAQDASEGRKADKSRGRKENRRGFCPPRAPRRAGKRTKVGGEKKTEGVFVRPGRLVGPELQRRWALGRFDGPYGPTGLLVHIVDV
jgi:hypothetical protein